MTSKCNDGLGVEGSNILSGVGLIAILLSCVLFARGQTKDVALRQFQHTAWGLSSGAPSQINALAQTTDGFLWLGTVNGLYRFDGISFELFRPRGGQRFKETSIQSLTATKDGGLWIGYTFGELDLLKNGSVIEQRLSKEYAGATVYSVVDGIGGESWACTIDGVLNLKDGEWQKASETKSLPITSCYSLFNDREGTLWLTTDDFLYRLPKGATKFEKTTIPSDASSVVGQGPDGTLWRVNQQGAAQFQDLVVHQPGALPRIATEDSPSAIVFDRGGGLWILGASHGLARIPQPESALRQIPGKQGAKVERFTALQGLTADMTLATLLDREGNIWIATASGLDRFRRSIFDPAPLPVSFGQYALAIDDDGSLLVGTQSDGLQRYNGTHLERVRGVSLDDVSCTYKAPEGKLWLGGKGDLGYIEHGAFHRVAVPANIRSPRRDTQALTTGPDGDLWLQVAASGPSFLRYHNGEWSPVVKSKPAHPVALTLVRDHLGQVWGGYLNGVVRIFGPNESVTRIDSRNGIDVGNVSAIYDTGSNVWIGGERGLDAIVDHRPVPIKFSGDQSVGGISGIIRGQDGSLWLNSSTGVIRIAREDEIRALKDHLFKVPYEQFDYRDGLSAQAPQMRPLPSIIRGRGNTLWFTTTNGAFSLDTANILRNPLAPPVSITGVIVDGLSLPTDGPLMLRKGAQSLRFDFAALSLSIPERVRFRYRLKGYDNAWQDGGGRRQAFYSHLAPGRYEFQVIACNNSGVWNTTGSSFTVVLPPTFIQSWYFKFLLALLVIALLRMLVKVRTAQETAKMRVRMSERFNERQRIARDLHDTFLQGVQGILLHVQAASRQLPAGDPARRSLEQTLVDSDAVMLQGRELLLNLRTAATEAQELPSRFQAAAVEFSHLHPAEFKLTVVGDVAPLDPTVCEELLKLGREALRNAYQHADANMIEAILDYGKESLRLTFADDGKGIAPEILANGQRPNHWGLPGMKERASAIGASFQVDSDPSRGTRITVVLASGLAYRLAS